MDVPSVQAWFLIGCNRINLTRDKRVAVLAMLVARAGYANR
jgi:hypothetical protein